MLRAIATGAMRSVALPWLLGLRWAGQSGEEGDVAAAGAPLRLKVAVDELFFAAEMATTPFVPPWERHRIRAEIDAAIALFERRGWLDEPTAYHRRPSPPRTVSLRRARAWGGRFEHARFASGWTPHRGEPGRERWLSYAPNRTAHAWLLRHEDRPRAWVVCVPGYRMGHPGLDLLGFRAGWLHRELGLNVAVPVLPLHGPRRVGRRGGDGFLSGDVLDTLHAKAQAAWDVRRLMAWLRGEGAPAVALYGVSLGAFTSGLVAGLEDGLDCLVAGIPAADFVDILRANAPAPLVRASDRLGFPWSEVRRALRVVSPLALEPRIARTRRFVYAATHDRLAPPAQARALWEHWRRPRIEWYPGSHCSFLLERGARELVREALAATGVLDAALPHPAAAAPTPRGASASGADGYGAWLASSSS